MHHRNRFNTRRRRKGAADDQCDGCRPRRLCPTASRPEHAAAPVESQARSHIPELEANGRSRPGAGDRHRQLGDSSAELTTLALTVPRAGSYELDIAARWM